MERLGREFFEREAKLVAKELVGKVLCVKSENCTKKSKIIETEAYLGSFDSASHARFGKTPRASRMWENGGNIYVYMTYGLHYMLNFVTGKEGEAQAVLVRSVEDAVGPGRLTKFFGIDDSFKKEDATTSFRIWIEDAPSLQVESSPRIGIGYASEKDQKRKLRFIIKKNNKKSH